MKVALISLPQNDRYAQPPMGLALHSWTASGGNHL